MPNTGWLTETQRRLVESLYPVCNYNPPKKHPPLFCPKCGLLGAHRNERGEQK